MKSHYLFTCLLALTLVSCARFIGFLNGAHNPRLENRNSIRSYSGKMGWRQDNLYTLRDSAAFHNFFRTSEGIPALYLFNKDMFLLEIKEEARCNSIIDSIIDYLEPVNTYPIDSSIRLTSWLPDWCDMDGNLFLPDDLKQADFYVVLYWAKYIGHLNKRDVYVWEEKLNEKSKTMGITVLKVNCDLQESWLED